jgi:CubicO group peptidase (beta-lactamase class C family)
MHALALALSLALAFAPAPQDSAPPFPSSTALAERISPEGLKGLSDLVQSFVDNDDIVGAELLVIVNGHTLLHQGYGWRDRDRKLPMEAGGVFCVRSMTKPLIGAAIWMLIEEGKLSLDDHAAQYLPSFDVESKREITIRQLLTHKSGLPMSLIIYGNPGALESVRAVADLGGTCELVAEPGVKFHYSDQGTDTLTAVLEVVAGQKAEDFLRARLLEPLGMTDTTCRMTADHPLRARQCSAYAGSKGVWTRYWSPQDPELFGTFLGSQGLYSTAVDYARFLDLYLQRGRAGSERLLRANTVRRTLTAEGSDEIGPTSLPGARAEYGTLMQVWTRAGKDSERELLAFGHTGSDGTHAWAFPEQKAMVLYFTQSRGTQTGLRVEERLGELLLGVPFDPLQAAPPLEEYLGYYWEGEGDLYRAIVRDGDDMALEIVGKAVVPLDYIGEDRWKLRPQPATVLAFDRDEGRAVIGYHVGDHIEYRLTPRADLPEAGELAERVAAAHHVERLEGQGVVRMQGTIDIPNMKRSGKTVMWLEWPGRWRIDEVMGEEIGRISSDHGALRMQTLKQDVQAVEGEQAELLRQQDPFLRFGDWRLGGGALTVIQELGQGDDHVLLVRAGDCSAPAPTLYVDVESGRLQGMAGLTVIPGAGRIGQRARYSDWLDVGGALLPGRIEVELALPMIGKLGILSVFQQVELGVDVPEGHFALAD